MELRPHPETPPGPAARIEAVASRPAPGVLRVDYALAGATRDFLIPAPAPSERADELWKHTCFEAFVRASDGPGYVELNVAPSTRWAAYAFDGYRKGMRDAAIGPPRVEVVRAADGLSVGVEVDLSAAVAPDQNWRLALSAVVEALSGAKTYWALAHPQGRPDFHDAAGFRLELAQPNPSLPSSPGDSPGDL